MDGRKLHLIDVNFTNDGVYQCTAENNYGMIVSATWVHVKGRYKIYGEFYSTRSPKVDTMCVDVVVGKETEDKGRKK